jgi:hypothetical protein
MIFETSLPHQAASRSFTPLSRPMLQRKCSCGGKTTAGGECEECKTKKKRLQRRALRDRSGAEFALGADTMVQRALRSRAQPLNGATRAFMESRFGHDFGSVRIHRGPEANAAAQAVHAAAFTIGRDIVVADPFYEPESSAGQYLLAHELAHTIQQRSHSDGATTSFEVSGLNDPSETEADMAAARVMTGPAIGGEPVAGLSATAPALAKTDCSKLTYKTCKGQSCGYAKSGVCGWGGIALGCRCMGAKSPPASKVLEVLLIIGISISLLLLIIAALADPEPVTKLGLLGLSAAQIALLLSLLGYEDEDNGASTSEGTASTFGGDATAVNPQNVA